MTTDFKNFLNKLSEEQLSNLKEIFQQNEEEKNDKDSKKSEEQKETRQKEQKTEEQVHQETENYTQEEKGEEVNENTFEKNHAIVNNDFTITRNTNQINRKTPVKFKKNEWKDIGDFRDIETPNFEKTPRNRPRPNKEKVECHVCGRTFSINASLIYGDYHRCNKCTGR